MPWDTCFGGYDGYLSLPNPSLNADGRDFVVSGSISVDTTRLATPQGPAEPLWTAPRSPARPARWRRRSSSTARRSCASDRDPRRTPDRLLGGPGKLQAALGSPPLRTFALRAGNNGVRFKLPASAVKALRKTASARAASVLRLTSFSTDGAKGATVTRKLTVTRATRR